MVVIAATWIEPRMATGAFVCTFEILCHTEFLSACATHHRQLVPFARWPYVSRMAGQRIVAVFAGIVDPAAPHFDGDDVELRAVVCATALRVQTDTAHSRTRLRHGSRVEDSKALYLKGLAVATLGGLA